MIIVKSEREIELMRRAGKITAAARALAGEMVKPGVTTREIDKAVFHFIRSQGAEPSFLNYNGYPASVCVSVNDEIIHGIPGPRVLKEGDIVSVDVGAYIGGFHGDCAATYPCGKISEEAQRLIDVTRQSFFEGFAQAREGNRISDISHAVQAYVEANGFSVVRENYRPDRGDWKLDLRCGDYITPERFIPRRGYPGVDWESCMTVSDKWGYNRYDTNIKSPETIIEKLVECVTKGGNLLLNVNPMADGTIPEKVAATMRGVGRWLNINGEAVYGTRAFMQLDQPATINRQGDIFIFLIPPPDKGPAQPPSEGTMKELTAGAEHARMQPLDATGYENDGGTAVTLPAGYSKALLLGDNTALPVVNGTVLFKAHEHSKTPCSVIKLSK